MGRAVHSWTVIVLDRRRVDELGISYVEKLSLYEEYASRVRNLVQDLIEREDIEIHSIEGWAKAPVDLVRSLNARGDDRDTELESVLDLVTVRVLLRFPEDVCKVEEIVLAEFDVDHARSVSSSGLEDPFRFGYPAVVYTLALSESRSSLREWGKYRGLGFRLELRTMLQEAWATIVPRVNLNVDSVSEKKLKRRLIRLAALLEEADEGFLSLWEEVKDIAVLVPPQDPAGPRNTTVTAERIFDEEELYDFFKAEPNVLSRWNSLAVKAGFPIFVPAPDYLKDSFKYLYAILRAAGIDTLSEVRRFLADMEEDDRGLQQLQTIREAFAKESAAWRVDPFSAVFLLVLNLKWDTLKEKDLVQLNIKKGSDRISGID